MSTEIGRQAEQAVAEYLERLDFKVLERNWRNKWCEIDIVAQKADEIHLVEVKYRQHHSFGGGFGAITADKVQRLRRAALAFSRSDSAVIVDVVAVTGKPGQWQIELLENAVGVS